MRVFLHLKPNARFYIQITFITSSFVSVTRNTKQLQEYRNPSTCQNVSCAYNLCLFHLYPLRIGNLIFSPGMKRREALKLFAEKAWDRTDKAEKDVTRYQSNPGQATAYMIGQLRIWQVRNDTKARIEAHKKTFKEKDFHYQVLSQGSSPLTHLESHMRKFADCVIQPHSEGCEYIIRSLSDETVMDEVTKKPHKPFRDQPYQEHFD